MDTSEKYIKMCEQAKEVQKSYFELFRKSEFRYNFLDWICLDKSFYHIDNDLRTIIWLPRQDQSQKMVHQHITSEYIQKKMVLSLDDHSEANLHAVVDRFCRWYEDQIEKRYSDMRVMFLNPTKFSSMEQLWLAFVMHEKYSKVWDNKQEEWIK